jgi:hypothetical protein
MSCEDRGCLKRDLIPTRIVVAVWYLPTLLVLAGLFAPGARAWLWIPSFAVMGIACLINARRCGRLHCFVTGPLFLAGAVATVLDAFEITNLGGRLIAGIVIIGTVVGYGLEWKYGTYARTSRTNRFP